MPLGRKFSLRSSGSMPQRPETLRQMKSNIGATTLWMWASARGCYRRPALPRGLPSITKPDTLSHGIGLASGLEGAWT